MKWVQGSMGVFPPTYCILHMTFCSMCAYRCTYYVVIVDNNYIAKVLSIESPCLLIKVLQTTRLGELDNVNKHIIFVQV